MKRGKTERKFKNQIKFSKKKFYGREANLNVTRGVWAFVFDFFDVFWVILWQPMCGPYNIKILGLKSKQVINMLRVLNIMLITFRIMVRIFSCVNFPFYSQIAVSLKLNFVKWFFISFAIWSGILKFLEKFFFPFLFSGTS